MKNVPTTQNLFTYGTLRSDQPEHTVHGPPALARSKARVPGTLYQLAEGYPILHVPAHFILRLASHDWKSDWEQVVAMMGRQSFKAPNAESFAVEGELIETPLERDALVRPDQWEGFTVGESSVYQRVIVPAIHATGSVVPAWAYTCSEIPASATLIPSGYWKRPPGLGA